MDEIQQLNEQIKQATNEIETKSIQALLQEKAMEIETLTFDVNQLKQDQMTKSTVGPATQPPQGSIAKTDDF